MASLNLDLDYFEHIKTQRLVARLGPGSELFPIKLWAHVGKHRPKDGVLEGYSPEEIANACGCLGDAQALLQALLDIGFLETWQNSNLHRETSDGNLRVKNESLRVRYKVHGWLERSGHLAVYKKRAEKAAKSRWSKVNASSNASSIPKHSSSMPKQCPDVAVQDVAKHKTSPTPSLPSATSTPNGNGIRQPNSAPLGTLKINGQPFIPDPVIPEEDRMTPEEMVAIRRRNMAPLPAHINRKDVVESEVLAGGNDDVF